MFSAADLIAALRNRRTLKSIRPEAVGQLPTGWQVWLEAMPRRSGAVKGADTAAIVAVLLQRSLRDPPPRGIDLDRWQAFATMWRQQWHPASRDERWIRVTGMVGSSVVHLVLAVMLAWLMYVRFIAITAPAEQSVVQVEYIGTGTPETPGGDASVPSPREAPAQPAPARPDAAPAEQAVQPAVSAPAPALPDVTLPEIELATPVLETMPPLPSPEIVEPRPSPPIVRQPLQVTQVPRPDIEFVLPPTIPRTPELAQPKLAVPELAVPTREIEVVDIPTPLPAMEADALQPRIAVPELSRPMPEVAQRSVPAPVRPRIRVPVIEPGELAQPQPRLAMPEVGVPELSVPAPATAAVPAPSPASVPVQSPANAAPEQSTADAADAANAATAPASTSSATPAPVAGVGPEPTPRAGAWPTPIRGDDWGEALRDRPGSQAEGESGLFDDSGRPRLAGDPGQSSQGAPPGSDARQAIDLDRAGTWLKRPPYDYTPTSFDRFWIPSGTLLEEWVRKGIREISIPIPGTSKSIDCVVSMLQLGAGCGISDPNLNDQPATARPPPDVPYKPELQERRD